MDNIGKLLVLALKNKYRFPNGKGGELVLEQLWDLPLVSANGISLDTTAKAVNAQLKAHQEESFVATSSPAVTVLANKLEIVKFVIADKQAAVAARQEAANRSAKLNILTEALIEKEIEEVKNLSPEELRKQIAELSS